MLDFGIVRSNPDYYAVTVMNEIFGGGFSSRLFNNLRTGKGLGVFGGRRSRFRMGPPRADRHRDANQERLARSKASTGLDREIDDLLKTAPTAEELKRAKDNILNSFIFQFDTPEKVLREKMAYEFYHYPLNFLEQYRSQVEKVTADNVLRVARKYVHKDQMAVLVVGNESDFDKPLSSLGPVQKVDIAIPPPPASLMGGGSAASTQ